MVVGGTGGFDMYMIVFETIVFSAAFIVIYLYWNTSFALPFSLSPPRSEEGFLDTGVQETVANITMCPGISKSYTAKNGDTLCCEGNPAGTDCEGKTLCTLSSTGTKQHPSCAEYLKASYAQKAKNVCPRSLPSYYEDDTGRSFCTNGTLNQELNAPNKTSAERCSIGQGGMNDPNSCEARVALDRMECPKSGCKKVAQAFGKEPVTLMATFRDSSGITRTCYDKDSLMNVWRETLGPDWRAKRSNIDFDANIMFCDVAKKYYIDKTLSRSKIQI